MLWTTVVACGVFAAMIAACAPEPPAATPHEIDAPAAARNLDGTPVAPAPTITPERRAASHAYLAEQKAKLAANEDRARRAAELKDQCDEEQAAAAQIEQQRDAERVTADAEVEKRKAWFKDHCSLRAMPTLEVQHCDPICWVETIPQCPEYACRAKPPVSGWLEAETKAACPWVAHAAKAILVQDLTASKRSACDKLRDLDSGAHPSNYMRAP